MRALLVLPAVALAAAGCLHGAAATSVGYPPAAERVPMRAYRSALDDVWRGVERAVAELGWAVQPERSDRVQLPGGSRVLVAHTPMSLWTWGDEVMVIAGTGRGGVEVGLLSTSGQLVDWGKNRDNIERFYAALDRVLGEPGDIVMGP